MTAMPFLASGEGGDGHGTYRPVPTVPDDNPPDPPAKPKLLSQATLARIRAKTPKILTFRDRGLAVMRHSNFQVLMAILILSNAIVIGLETDLVDYKRVWNKIEHIFLFVFSLELFLRLLLMGPRTYFNVASDDFGWNVIDFFIVTVGLFDFATVEILSFESKGGGFATLFRILRLLRILRIFRIVRFLKQLYMLALGLALATSAVCWVSVLMTFILYVCAIVMVRTIGRSSVGVEGSELLVDHFSTIPQAMLTLFELMAEPDLAPYREIMPQYPLLTFFLIFYVMFGSFGMIALLTGVISESMFEKNQIRMEEERLERDKKRQELKQLCQDMFDDLPLENGCADRADVEDLLPDIEKLFEVQGIAYAASDFEGIMEIMDKSGSSSFNREEFCRCILMIAEGVRPLSLMEIHNETIECIAQVKEVKADVGSSAAHLQGEVTELRQDMEELVAHLRSREQLELAECMSHLLGLRESVEKCLSYLEGTATKELPAEVHAAKPLGVSTAACEPSVADPKAPRVQGQASSFLPCYQGTTYQNHKTSEAHFDALQAVLVEALENAFAAKMEAEQAKLEAEVSSMASRLACHIRALTDGQKQKRPPLEAVAGVGAGSHEVVVGCSACAGPEDRKEAAPGVTWTCEPEEEAPATACRLRNPPPADVTK